MPVIVTRPPRDAQRWVLDLQALGLHAVALPLIDVGPVDDASVLAHAWQHLTEYRAVMFVSGNAVDYFFKAKPPLAGVSLGSIPLNTRAWAPGPGTADALLKWGVEPGQVDSPSLAAGQFDSEALWQVVQAQVRPGNRVLIVRGGDSAGAGATGAGVGRDWLAQRLTAQGALPDFVVAYQRRAPHFSAHEAALARAGAAGGSVWLFSSSEALANLQALLPGQSWAGARALATHPRIAAAARAAGFGVVQESRPLFAEVVVSLQRLAQSSP